MHSCQALSPGPDDHRLSRTEGLSWAAGHGLEVVGNGSWNAIGIYGSHMVRPQMVKINDLY